MQTMCKTLDDKFMPNTKFLYSNDTVHIILFETNQFQCDLCCKVNQ